MTWWLKHRTQYSFYHLQEKTATPAPFAVGSSPFGLQPSSRSCVAPSAERAGSATRAAGWAGSAVPKPCPGCGGEIWLCVLAALCRDKSPRRSPVRVSLWSLRSWGLLSWATAYLVIRQFFSPRKALERVLFLTSARSPGTCPWLPQSMFSVFIKTYWSQESLRDWF